MKTRIVHTRIWEDEWFCGLSSDGQKLFIYLITNQRINICGMYRISDRVLYFDTKIRLDKLEKVKNELAESGKVLFYDGWVFVKNAQRLGGYKGEKNDAAAKQEKADIPDNVKNCFLKGICDRVSEKEDRVLEVSAELDTSINHKSKIINHKSEIISFDEFWNLYDKKIGRPKSEDKWNKLSLEVQKKILEYIPNYKLSQPNKTYRKNPETFFNNKGWEDEIISEKPVVAPLIPKTREPEPMMSEEDRKKNLAKMAEMKNKLKGKLKA